MRFDDKVVIVTGAGSGIGRAMAEAFAAEGARLAIVEVNAVVGEIVASDLRSRGYEAILFATDVASSGAVRAMTNAVVDAFGRIDVLINNAAIRIIKPLLDHSDEDWQRTLDVDLSAAFYTTKAAIPHMLRTGKGKIVNVASIAGLIGRPNRVAYCTAKAGLIAFTQAAAADMAGQNIYINALAPGSIASALNAEYSNDADAGAAWAEETLIRRWGKPAEVAEAAMFLTSDASDYITGTVLRIDGGWLSVKARNQNE